MARIGRRQRSSKHPAGMRYVLVVASIAVLYVISGRLGLMLAHLHANVTLIWPPTGLSLAALVLFGRRVWPGVLLGSLITTGMIGAPLAPLIAIGIGNTLEAIVGATLLGKVARFDPAFARLRDVIGFAIHGALLSTTVSATIGVSSLYLAGVVDGASFSTVWLVWWLGDAGGATVVAPLLLVGIAGRPPWALLARRATSWIALTLLVVLSSFAFAMRPAGVTQSLLPALLVFPVLVWAGLRLGPRGAIVGSFVASTVAVVGTARGLGPFAGADPSGSPFLVWAYVSTIGMVAMVLAAAVAEREDAELRRQQGEEERARLSAQVQHAQRLESLGMLAGGVAHDFNNLLVAIRCNAELLKLGERQYDAQQREALLDEIDAASVQAASLCQQLLTYAGHNRLERQRLNLLAIVRESLPLLRGSTPRTIDLQVDGDPAVFVEGDRTQIGRILMNLVLNASESIGQAADGCVRVWVGVREVDQDTMKKTFLHSDAPPGRYAVLEVSDNGSGMSSATLERIFDPFFSTKRTGRGLGMGVVLGIVAAHEGAIKVRSCPGQGTSFAILLPLAVALDCPGQCDESYQPKRRAGGTVLLAEDEDRVRRTLRLLLERSGYAVIEARDGMQAVELFAARANEIDVALLDVTMPGLNGPDALAQIHGLDPSLPAVLMSGYDEGRVDPASSVAFVQKPFQIDQLLDCIGQATQRRRQPQSCRKLAP